MFWNKGDKGSHEMAYWRKRKAAEGILGNGWYKYFFTTHFGFDDSFYSGKKILDIGCGPRGSLEWADMSALRVGLDPLADIYKKLGTDKHKMNYSASGSESIPYPDCFFDVVSSFNSLDHVNDLEKTISEIKRVLKPGETFLLLTDVNHKPTRCEPVSFSWNIVDRFTDALELVDVRHYEKSKNGMYDSVRANVKYDHTNKADRCGILSVRFVKPGRIF